MRCIRLSLVLGAIALLLVGATGEANAQMMMRRPMSMTRPVVHPSMFHNRFAHTPMSFRAEHAALHRADRFGFHREDHALHHALRSEERAWLFARGAFNMTQTGSNPYMGYSGGYGGYGGGYGGGGYGGGGYGGGGYPNMSYSGDYTNPYTAYTSSSPSPSTTVTSPNVQPAQPVKANPIITEVGIYDNRFEPKSITISPGTTVRWTNYGNANHTVTSDTGLWDSRALTPGSTTSYTFTQPGTYGYHCTLHSQDMRGTVIVQ